MIFSSLTSNFTDNDSAGIIVACVTSILIGWMGFRYARAVSNIRSDKFQRLPPAPDNMGLIPFLIQLLGTNGPQFALKMARTEGIGYVFCTPGLPSMFRPEAWIEIGEPRLGRRILEDPQSTKPFLAYQVFDKALSGESFFTRNGTRANHVRKSTAAAFSTKNVQIMSAVVDQVLEEWIVNRLEPLYVKTGTPIDFDEEMMVVTTEVIAKAGFGYQLSSEDRIEFATKMRTIMEVFFHQNFNLPRKLCGFLFRDIREARRMAVELKDKFGHGILQSARDNNKNNNNNKSSILVNLMLQDSDYEDDEERARDILIFFFAGFETTAHTIAYCMLELAKNPQEQSELRTQLDQYADDGEDLKQCPHLKRVTREVLRLHPAAALGSTRIAAKDIKVPKAPPFDCKISDSVSNDKTDENDSNNHWIIPKGSYCSVVYYMILRNHHIFGDNADEFVPSRWECPSDEMLKAYLPFAAGKRNCQGMALAYLELNAVVARLVSSYTLELVEEGEPCFMIALRPNGSKILLKKI